MKMGSSTYFKDLTLLFFLTLLAYWPLSLNYLSLKNDALVYLAYRYQSSEAIRHGFLPFWSPYFYTGFPIHADIQGGIWNPFVLLLTLFSKYDMTLLQWEVLIYLFLSSVGMYRLIKYLGLSRPTAICCAIAFMGCGYITDSVSIVPWVSSAAFIPFILLYFLRSLKSLLLSDALKLSISLSLMFLCGYPSFFIYLNYILGISFLLWSIYQIKNHNSKAAARGLLHLGIAGLSFVLICSPAMISYYEFLPYYSRGYGVSYDTAAQNPMVPLSLITYLLPNAVSKVSSLSTDLSMKNTYIGLFIFLFFLLGLKKSDKFKTIILVFTLFSFLFSLGDLSPVHQLSYHLPLMNTFRHPGTIRAFTSLGMILLSAYSIDSFFKERKEKKIQWVCYLCLLFLFSLAVYFLVTHPHLANQPGFHLNTAALKLLLHSLSFQQFALIICVLQIFFVLGFLFVLRRKTFSKKIITGLFILNTIVFTWIALPFTVVSQYKTSEVNNFIHSFPAGYPFPNLNASIESDVYSDSLQLPLHGYPNFYNKKITIQDYVITPTLNTAYGRFLINKNLRSQLKDRSFIYATKDSVSIQPSEIKLLKFTPNMFSFRVETKEKGKLQLFQQYNSNWSAYINDKPVQIQKSNIAFMSVSIPQGVSVVKWKYRPKKVYPAMMLSVLSLFALLFYFVVNRKQRSL